VPGNLPGVVLTLPSNTAPATDASSALWAGLVPQVTVQSVTIQSAPVVRFTVTDGATGLPVVGLGNTSRSSSATVAGLTNLSFAIAKLVPGESGSPSKWVTYIVTTVPTTTSAAAPSRPTTDNTGMLVDNHDGTYAYTFYRDITRVKDDVAAMTVNPPNNKDDLGDLTYEPTLVHRVTIQLSGSAPGTGSTRPINQLVPSGMAKPVDAMTSTLRGGRWSPIRAGHRRHPEMQRATAWRDPRRSGGFPVAFTVVNRRPVPRGPTPTSGSTGGRRLRSTPPP
jgi:hypothetical protein